jgi:Domain of unknown function (DU1801)
MHPDILTYNQGQATNDAKICDILAKEICEHLPEAENKIWHGHPVWFLNWNPIVGYSKQKAGIKLLFWSWADFDEIWLAPGSGKFQDAWIFYNDVTEIHENDLKRWLKKSREIQWDYKNIVKKRGVLERL